MSCVAMRTNIPLQNVTKAVSRIDLVATEARVNTVARMLVTVERLNTQSL